LIIDYTTRVGSISGVGSANGGNGGNSIDRNNHCGTNGGKGGQILGGGNANGQILDTIPHRYYGVRIFSFIDINII